MTGRKRSPARWTAFVAALATFTALVWIGVIVRVVISRSMRETPVAQAPPSVESQPIHSAASDRATRPAATPKMGAMAPGGNFPGDVPSVKR